MSTPPPADPGVLHKVRSLLAKAESTTFPDEADALTAKAQELMDRHAIDRAVLAASAPGHHGLPEGRDLTIEVPYASEKFHLLSEVAAANRCKAVYAPWAGTATVVGFPEDQETVELLYTSLLVQATSAMLAGADHAARRTRRYRHAFLVAFAARIGERLRAADEAVTAEADRDHGGAVLPVLASRAEAVDDELARRFPHVRQRQVSVSDPAGWHAGTAAAERARLGSERPLRRSHG
jgi:hypothetical protein